MKQKLLLTAFLLAVSLTQINAQVCDILIPICTSQDGLNNNSIDPSPITIESSCQTLQGTRTSWYYILIEEPTDFTFQIEPTGDVDYDFAVWVNADCANLGVADRASYDAPPPYDTGLTLTATETCEGALGTGNVMFLSLVPGDEVIIVVDRFSSTPDTFNLTFGDPEAFDCSIVANEYICEGGFTIIEATDIEGTDYQWFVYNEVTEVFDILPGETNPTLEVNTSGLYLVEYLDSLGAAAEDEIQVNITELPLPELSFTEPLEFCEDEPIVIDATPTNIDDLEGVTYVWYYEGVEIPGETSAVLNAAPNNYGTYTVEIGQIVEDCDLTVDIDVTGCVVDPDCITIDFLEDFGTGVGRFETPFTNYTFQPAGQVDDGQYVISNSTAGLNTGWFTDMTDHTGDPDGRMLVVNAAFDPGEFYRRTITLASNLDYTFRAWITTVYDTDTAICTGTGIPANVIFRIEDIDGNTIAETTTGDIINGSEPDWQEYLINFNSLGNTDVQLVLVNNSIGGCGNDLAIDDISLTYSTDQPVIATPDNMVQCDLSGTTSIFDLTTQIPAILDGQDPADFNVSFHLTEFEASTNTDPIANPEAYQNTENPQTIYVRVENAAQTSCFSIVSFDLIVEDGIDIETDLPETLAFCDNEASPTLDATPTNAGIDLSLVTYEWYFEGDLISQDAEITPSESGVYTVIIEYDGCSQITVDIDVEIQEAPLLDLGMDETFCDGESFEIVPVLSGNSANTTYLWSTGETTPTIIVNTTGNYTLEITDGSCVVTDGITITFGDFAQVGINDTIFSCPNETQLLTATSSISDVTYTWFRNGVEIAGETASTIEVLIDEEVLNGAIIYSVEVNSNGCVSTAEVEVRPYPNNANCVISQGLSPDGSIGLNDNFDLSFLAARTGIANLQIFNRQGRTVYEKSNYTNEWTGNSDDGNKLPTGTYYYVITFSGEDPVYGNQKTGWIYINRGAN